MKSEFIEEKLINALNGIEDAAIISSLDFSENRAQCQVIVDITGETQINFNLPDIRFDVEIGVNTFIDEDKEGKLHSSVVDAVKERLSKYYYYNSEASLEDLFETDEIVYFQNDSITNFLDPQNKANRTIFKFTVIGSFE